MRTFANIPGLAGRRPAAGDSGRPGSRIHSRARRERAGALLQAEQGDTLIEVLISAVLVAIIVVGALTGLDNTNHATALQRARSQADALAEQNEEQVRSEPINKLAELESKPETKTVTEGATVYTIETTAAYVNDTTGTASCTSGAAKAEYLQTSSTVKWAALGPGKPVVETSIISPPPGASLIVQVTQSGTPLKEALVTATGPAPETTKRTLETSVNGCVILPVLPGEYKVNASKPGYVTVNGFTSTESDPSTTHSVYIPAETTAKEGYYLGRPGNITVNFSGNEGDTFVAFNTGMTVPKPFGTVGSYKAAVPSETGVLYPFPTKYTVYAGTCEADKPTTIKAENEVLVPAAGTGTATLTLPALNLEVYEGTKTTPLAKVSGASGHLYDEGCKTTRYFTTSATGSMPAGRAGLPYGKYSLCVTAKVGSPAKQRRFESKTPLEIATSSGVTEKVYLGEAPESGLTAC